MYAHTRVLTHSLNLAALPERETRERGMLEEQGGIRDERKIEVMREFQHPVMLA